MEGGKRRGKEEAIKRDERKWGMRMGRTRERRRMRVRNTTGKQEGKEKKSR